MLSENVLKSCNEQINAELFSAYLYLAMSAYLEEADLAGAAHWMRCQAQEEMTHAGRIIDYLTERDGRVLLDAIEKPQEAWETPQAAFEAAYGHELKISAMINDLVSLARDESDHMTENFLQWFVAEQVEEESSVKEVVRQLKIAGPTGGGLLLVDRELATRVFALPVPGA
ncbi:ferritin [bacterium]|nr:ferritin [bacterium]